MSGPVVSVVTVVRNNAADLGAAIDSVALQDYPHIEHIIVDGGSTDGTLDVVRANAEHIASWISEPDDGIYDAINKGIRLATGDVIGILNSDDRMLPGTVRAVAAAHRDRPDAGIIHGQIAVETADGRPLRTARPRGTRTFRYFTTPFKHPAMFVTRQCYDELGPYDLRYKLAADYEFMLRALRADVVSVYIPVALTRVRAVGKTTGTQEISGIDELRAILESETGSPAAAALILLARRGHRMLKKRELRRMVVGRDSTAITDGS